MKLTKQKNELIEMLNPEVLDRVLQQAIDLLESDDDLRLPDNPEDESRFRRVSDAKGFLPEHVFMGLMMTMDMQGFEGDAIDPDAKAPLSGELACCLAEFVYDFFDAQHDCAFSTLEDDRPDQEALLVEAQPFEEPAAASDEEVANLRPGDFVKIIAGRERFWVQITVVEGGTILGTVDNILIFTNEHGYQHGDVVKIAADNILDIQKGVRH